jgi:hypothetical protein
VSESVPQIYTYYRLESPSQTSETAERQQNTLEIWGSPPRNMYQSDIPKVKAYEGKLPEGKRGIEFTTDIMPDSGCRPGEPVWSGPRMGVTVEDGYAKIKVLTIANYQLPILK